MTPVHSNVETRNPVIIDPAQITRVVFGLRDRPASLPCALGRDLQLASMDAPDLLPAGSMTATEYADGPVILMESNVRRYPESRHV